MEAWLLRGAAPLDALRCRWFAWLGQRAWGARLLAQRRARLGTLMALHMGLAATGAVLAPAAMLVLGPVLLGVPHLAADVRYLALHPRATRAWRVGMLSGCGALLALALCPPGAGAMRWEVGLGAAWALAAVGAARPRWIPGLVLAGAPAVIWAVSHAETCRLILAHAHNAVALILWAALWGRGRGRWPWALAALGVAALLGAGLAAELTRAWAWAPAWGWRNAARSLAPGLPQAQARGVVSAFAFLQAVHYWVWLVNIPQERTRRECTLSWRMTARGWLADVGAPACAAVLATCILLGFFALAQPLRAVWVYLQLSSFHAYLELAAGAALLLRRRLSPGSEI